MHARSALFDVYGDHLRARGDRARWRPWSGCSRPLGIAAPAVRTAISRMVRQGWLEPVRLPAGRGYAATAGTAIRARRRRAPGSTAPATPRWDGSWHLLVLDPDPQRSARDRVRSGLAFLGYAELLATAPGSARSPRPRSTQLLAREERRARAPRAHDDRPRRAGPRRAGTSTRSAAAYVEWLRGRATAARRPRHRAAARPDRRRRAAFAAALPCSCTSGASSCSPTRGCPPSCCPRDWAGHEARTFFTAEAERLLPGAARFVDDAA